MIAAFSLLAACKRDIQNPEAVRSSVVDYLRERQPKTGLNVDSMKSTFRTCRSVPAAMKLTPF
jgi:hypothetical protein